MAIKSALLYSLVETAKINGRRPYTYLKHLFMMLPQAQTLEDIEALLPWNVARPAPQAPLPDPTSVKRKPRHETSVECGALARKQLDSANTVAKARHEAEFAQGSRCDAHARPSQALDVELTVCLNQSMGAGCRLLRNLGNFQC